MPGVTLMQLCTENVYNDNIFYLLGLPTTATPRQVRHRREDLESAREMGKAEWRRAFVHLVGNRAVPTFAEVNEAFRRLDDPEYRFLSELLWVWPMGGDDAALKALLVGDRESATRCWEEEAHGHGKNSLAVRHNLAVFYHSCALAGELRVLHGISYVPPILHESTCRYWEEAFGYWSEIADDDDFWNIVEARRREFGDPRLPAGTIQRLRADLPAALDGIHARLAAEYLKRGKRRDAKRQADYMQREVYGPGGATEAVRLMLDPLEAKVGQLVAREEKRVAEDKSRGFASANELLNETKETIRLADFFRRNVAGTGDAAMFRIGSQVVSACNSFQVDYGEATQRWEYCLSILKRIKNLPCSQQLKDIIRNNLKAVNTSIGLAKPDVEESEDDVDETEECWFCGADDGTGTRGVQLYGDVERSLSGRVVRYKRRFVRIPICARCEKRESDLMKAVAAFVWGLGIPLDVFAVMKKYGYGGRAVEVIREHIGFFLGGFLVIVLAWIVIYHVAEALFLGYSRKAKGYHRVARLLARGYQFGEKP